MKFSIGRYIRSGLLSRIAVGSLRKKYKNQYDEQRNIYHQIKKADFHQVQKGEIVKIPFLVENFHPFHMDDSVLLNVLSDIGPFSFIPNPGNAGDCLIAKATYEFFKKNKIQYSIWDGKPVETVVYGGGGIWVKDYYEGGYLDVLGAMALAKRVVILPSSVYECKGLEHVLDKRFTVFCRERRSYDYLTSLKKGAEIILDHDMALRMPVSVFSENLKITKDRVDCLQKISDFLGTINNENGVGKLFRTDKEKKFSFETDFDLSRMFRSRTMSEDEVNFATIMMLSAVDSFNSILTDRLHVGIAAALMGKEVYLFDNNYGKVSGVYNRSLKDCPNIHLCSEMPDKFNLRQTKTDNFARLLHMSKQYS